MSASNDGSDPKGKSVETAINIAPRVLLVDDSPSDCVTTSIYLRRHDVLGIHDFLLWISMYFNMQNNLWRQYFFFKASTLNNYICFCANLKCILWHLYIYFGSETTWTVASTKLEPLY